jgi:hypothetical protein
MMPEGTAHRRADRCFATLRSDQRAKDQERNYRNDVALTPPAAPLRYTLELQPETAAQP